MDKGTNKKITVIATNSLPISDKPAWAPGIRSYMMAKELSERGHRVTLATPDVLLKGYDPDKIPANVELLSFDHEMETASSSIALESHCRKEDFVIIQTGGMIAAQTLYGLEGDMKVLLDCWGTSWPEHLAIVDDAKEEHRLSTYHPWFIAQQHLWRSAWRYLYEDRVQLPFYAGAAYAMGCIYDRINIKEKFVQVGCGAPFGLDCPGAYPELPIKGRLVPEDAFVALWFSGFYPWHDIDGIIDGIAKAVKLHGNVYFVAKGGRPPKHPLGESCLARAKELVHAAGIDNNAIFDDEGCPSEERKAWFDDSDVALFATTNSFEAKYLTTACRVLDFKHYGLPVLHVVGDELQNRISQTVSIGRRSGNSNISKEYAWPKQLANLFELIEGS